MIHKQLEVKQLFCIMDTRRADSMIYSSKEFLALEKTVFVLMISNYFTFGKTNLAIHTWLFI